MNSTAKNIMMIAAEASSAHYAVQLLQYWKSQKKNYYFYGVGSSQMESLGFVRYGKSEEMAVVGIAEILDNLKLIKSVFNSLLQQVEERRPDAVILMDYPDFNLRLAKKLKEKGIPVFYYISPQIWAWRQSRIHDIKAYCEKVFLLFPFEKAFYDRFQVPNEFVGHPLLDDLDTSLLDPEKIDFRQQQYGVLPHQKVLALMPGSRKGEIQHHMQIQLEVARKLLNKYPDLKLFIFVAPTLTKEYLSGFLENFSENYTLIKDEPYKMISLADFILVASGTATLQVGLMEKPMVIMYKVNWLTGVIGEFLTRGLKFFGLVNLVLDKEVAPELKQSEVKVDELVRLMSRYIDSEEFANQTRQELKLVKTALGDKGATSRVAESINRFLEVKQS